MTYNNSPATQGPLSREGTSGDQYRYAPFHLRLGAIALDSLIYSHLESAGQSGHLLSVVKDKPLERKSSNCACSILRLVP